MPETSMDALIIGLLERTNDDDFPKMRENAPLEGDPRQ